MKGGAPAAPRGQPLPPLPLTPVPPGRGAALPATQLHRRNIVAPPRHNPAPLTLPSPPGTGPPHSWPRPPRPCFFVPDNTLHGASSRVRSVPLRLTQSNPKPRECSSRQRSPRRRTLGPNVRTIQKVMVPLELANNENREGQARHHNNRPEASTASSPSPRDAMRQLLLT